MVFYRPVPGDYMVSHLMVDAETPEAALLAAEKELSADARIIRADANPTWSVDA